MQYVAIKHFKRESISGKVNISYGEFLDLRNDGFLYYKDKKICASRSAAAHEYFANNYDYQGLERGKITRAVISRLEPKNFKSRQERDDFWKEKIWNNSFMQKYKKSEYETTWFWNDDFYNAPVEDLKVIAKIIGAKII